MTGLYQDDCHYSFLYKSNAKRVMLEFYLFVHDEALMILGDQYFKKKYLNVKESNQNFSVSFSMKKKEFLK